MTSTRVRSSRNTSGMRFIPTVTAAPAGPCQPRANLHEFPKAGLISAAASGPFHISNTGCLGDRIAEHAGQPGFPAPLGGGVVEGGQ